MSPPFGSALDGEQSIHLFLLRVCSSVCRLRSASLPESVLPFAHLERCPRLTIGAGARFAASPLEILHKRSDSPKRIQPNGEAELACERLSLSLSLSLCESLRKRLSVRLPAVLCVQRQERLRMATYMCTRRSRPPQHWPVRPVHTLL